MWKPSIRAYVRYVSLSTPQAPAPRTTAVLTLSTRLTAAMPHSRRKASLWHHSQPNWSSVRLQTITALRLWLRTIMKACSRSGPRPTSMPGYSAQSVCTCAPGGVSTRRYVRIGGFGYLARMYRNTDLYDPA